MLHKASLSHNYLINYISRFPTQMTGTVNWHDEKEHLHLVIGINTWPASILWLSWKLSSCVLTRVWKTWPTLVNCDHQPSSPTQTVKKGKRLVILMVLTIALCDQVTPYDMHAYKSGSTLVEVKVCCLKAPSHYMHQCWLIISDILWHTWG